MKKLLYLASIATIALASCTVNEIVDKSGIEKPIEFSTYMNKAVAGTKGTVIDDAAIQATNTGFGINAAYTKTADFAGETSNFMYNQQVLYSDTAPDGSWGYTPIKYWPTAEGDKLSFFAYAPYTTDGSNGITVPKNDATANVFNFTVQDNPLNTVDFVAAGMQNIVTSTTPGTVDFKLKHELTRLAFEAKASEALWDETGDKNKTKVVIRSIKFLNTENLYQSATYTFGTATDNRGKWSAPTAFGKDYPLDDIINTEKIKMGTYQVTALALNGTTPVSMFKTDQFLFMLPVDNMEEGDIRLEIAYDIVTEDEALASGHSISSATRTISLPAGVMAQGTAYRFTYTFGVDAVVVSATVEPWGDEEVIN